MGEIMQFIPSQLGILTATLYILGMFFKSTSFVVDKYIPLVLLLFSVLFSVLLIGVSPTSILQGILCWGVSVGANQVIKQTGKDE